MNYSSTLVITERFLFCCVYPAIKLPPNSGSWNHFSADVIWFLELDSDSCSLPLWQNEVYRSMADWTLKAGAANCVKHSSSLLLPVNDILLRNFSLMNLLNGGARAANQKVSLLIDAEFPVYPLHPDPGLKGLLNKAHRPSSHLFSAVAHDTLTHTAKCLTNGWGSQRKLHKWRGWFITICVTAETFNFLRHFHLSFAVFLLFSNAAAPSRPGLKARHFYYLNYIISWNQRTSALLKNWFGLPSIFIGVR